MQKRQIPLWILHYETASYIILAIDCVCAICYLGFLAVYVSERKLYLPFAPSSEWLELNSYSILPPFCCIPLVVFLAYHIRYKTVFSDGDFYGVVGALLGLAAISMFDGARIVQVYFYHQIWTLENFTEALHSGVEGIIVTDFIYTLKILVGGQLVQLDFENTKDGMREEINGSYVFVTYPNNIVLPLGGNWTDPVLADGGIRTWTHAIQKELKCCGASNYKDWDNFSGAIYPDYQNDYYLNKHGNYPPSCFCKYSCPASVYKYERCFDKCGSSNDSDNMRTLQERKGCFKPYVKFLRRLYYLTGVLMIFMSTLYLLTICIYIVNFAALRQLASFKLKHHAQDNSAYYDNGDQYGNSDGPPQFLEAVPVAQRNGLVPHKKRKHPNRKRLMGTPFGKGWKPKNRRIVNRGSYHQFVRNAQPNSMPFRRQISNSSDTKPKLSAGSNKLGTSSKNQPQINKPGLTLLQEKLKDSVEQTSEEASAGSKDPK